MSTHCKELEAPSKSGAVTDAARLLKVIREGYRTVEARLSDRCLRSRDTRSPDTKWMISAPNPPLLVDDDELPPIGGPLAQMLRKLLFNAAKFSLTRKAIEVSIGSLRDGSLQLSVADIGIGIVALTASVVADGRRRRLAVGMDDYLAKPFTLEQMGGMLTTWLGPSKCPVPRECLSLVTQAAADPTRSMSTCWLRPGNCKGRGRRTSCSSFSSCFSKARQVF